MLKNGETTTDEQSGSSKNAGNVPKKRVRFLDSSVAQELIKREKLNHENRIKALRQKYNFSKETENESGRGVRKDANNNVVDIFPLEGLTRRPSTAFSLRTRDKDDALEKPRRVRSASLSRINELAQPRQRGKLSSSQNSGRRSAIVNLSPDHLRLSIPQKLPRSSNQLKELPEDELDYLLQPKSLKEFNSLVEMTRPAQSRSSSRASSAVHGRGVGRPPTAGRKMSDSDGDVSTGARLTPVATQPQTNHSRGNQLKPKFKPTLKLATAAVISSMNENRQRSEAREESPAMKAWTNILHSKSPTPATGRYVLPGGRVLRLRPRRLSWDIQIESKNKPEEEKKDTPKSSLENEKGGNNDNTKMAVPTSPSGKNRSMNYHHRTDPRSLDISQLTKDLAKCKYLRGTEDVT